MARRNQNVRLSLDLLRPNETIPHQELPIRIGKLISTSHTLKQQISKQCERMYALLAICTTLSPGPSDESIMSIVKEHYGEQLTKLQRGG